MCPLPQQCPICAVRHRVSVCLPERHLWTQLRTTGTRLQLRYSVLGPSSSCLLSHDEPFQSSHDHTPYPSSSVTTGTGHLVLPPILLFLDAILLCTSAMCCHFRCIRTAVFVCGFIMFLHCRATAPRRPRCAIFAAILSFQRGWMGAGAAGGHGAPATRP